MEGRATTVAEYVIAREHDEHIGLRFEDESWTWAEVVRRFFEHLMTDRAVDAHGLLF